MVLTSAILGTLVGGITSLIPGILEWLNRRENFKHEQTMLSLRSKYAQIATEQQIALVNATADANEGESLRRHDASIDSVGFAAALRASVRPVITYAFFALFVFIKAIAVWTFVQSSGGGDWLGNALAWNEIMPIIWDDNTAGIFGAIMGFWFGGRTIEKLRERPNGI